MLKLFIGWVILMGTINSHAAIKIEVQGHRGARSVRPENTLAAFNYAMENKIEILETDLLYTKDKILILGHDEKLNSAICLDSNGKKLTKDVFVSELTAAELQKYDCGSTVNPRFPKQVTSKQKMPTFEEFLTAVNAQEKALNMKFRLNVEIKVYNEYVKKNLPRMVKEILSALKKHKLYEGSNIQSFDIEAIDIVRAQDAKILTSFLIEEKMSDILTKLNLKTTSDLIKKYKFNILSPKFTLMTKEQVKDLQSQGIQVIVWTVNEPQDWKSVIEMEVDGIITDDPVALKDYLSKASKSF